MISRARALLVLLATLVLAWLTTPSALAGSPSPSPVHGYSYNSQLSVAQFSDAAGERGPSSTIYDHQNNAVSHGVRGATARSGAAAVSRFGAHRASSPHAYDGSVSSTPVTGGDAAAETPGGALHRTIACSAANRVAAKTVPKAVNGETAATAYSRLMHQTYNYGPGFRREFPLNSGRRADAVNIRTREVIELKPNNPRQIRQGNQQPQSCIDELNDMYKTGPRWTGRVETYDRP